MILDRCRMHSKTSAGEENHRVLDALRGGLEDQAQLPYLVEVLYVQNAVCGTRSTCSGHQYAYMHERTRNQKCKLMLQ